jgi:hypothetical protein
MDLNFVIISILHATIKGGKIIHTYPYPILHPTQWKKKKNTNHGPQMFHTNGKHKETYFYNLVHTFAQLSQSHTSPAPFILLHQPYLHCNILNTNIITIFPTTSNKPLKKTINVLSMLLKTPHVT